MSYRLDRAGIMKYLPHRDPFLMIDEVTEITSPDGFKDFRNDRSKAGIKVVAWKNVQATEHWVKGHFPGNPILPGVLIIETMAQAAAMSVYPFLEADIDRLAERDFRVILCGVDSARFRRPVVPGEKLRLDVEVIRVRSPLWSFKAKAWVGDQLAAEADILANLYLKESVS
ncbi:MAG: 3-hydroxyacyl-ACP dehydratase FabZ [Bdellovibrionales bacterium]|nr:3-hydroxyacyl-ACP dehydratase FabZ [Bdellovibrionales bacterium]